MIRQKSLRLIKNMMKIPELFKVLTSLVVLTFFAMSSCDGADHQLTAELGPLHAFIRAVDPKNSLRIHWNESPIHPCSYRRIGIRCDQHTDSITEIRLANLNLSGYLDAESVCKLPNLKVLVLSKNQIQGTISDSIANCRSLIHLDISNNFLSGDFPVALTKLKKLKIVDVSNNPLNKIDPFLQLESKLPKRYHLEEDASRPSPPPKGKRELEKKRRRIDLLTWILLAVAVSVLLLLILFYKMRARRSSQDRESTGEVSCNRIKTPSIRIMDEFVEEVKRSELVFFVDEHERFGLQEILESGVAFHNQSLNSSSNIYKVQLRNNSIFAVKRVIELQGSFEDFGQTMKKIGNLKHENLLPLIGYHSTDEDKFLIYRYQTNGSLLTLFEDYIQRKRAFPWELRLSIAVGIARGLDFIYRAFNQGEIIPHGNIKLSNILLNEKDEPLLSDYGYSKFVNHRKPSNVQAYTAPEKGLTEQADVYSFGVILLELLTGKIAENTGSTDLVRWVKSKVSEEWTGEIFDKQVGQFEIYGFSLLNISLKCVSLLPQDRPSMSEVLEKIEEVVDAHSENSP